MSSSLLDSLGALIPAGSLGPVATRLGESEAAVGRGVQAGFGAILAGLVSQLRDGGSMRQIYDLLTSNANDPAILDDVTGYLGAGKPGGGLGDLAGKLLASVFGGRSSAAGDAIARSTGLRSESAGTILTMVAPLVMGLLSRKIRQGGLDVAGLTSLLAVEKDEILKAAPAGISSLLGFSEIPRVGASVASGTGAAARAAASTGRRWLWPVAAAAALVALFFLVGRNRGPTEPVSTTLGEEAVGAMSEAGANAAEAVGDAAGAVRDLGAKVGRRLADGVELMIPERGIEAQMVSFIEDPNRLVDRTTWFDFDRLTFETGSAAIRPESQEQIDNIAAILKAYPAVRIKVGGYTDNTGDRSANVRLSQARADAVRAALISRGIAKDRVEAEGYGDQFSVASNTTEGGRAENRRIALRVTAK
jgi:OmpA-OmpF porin, OOP family